jgi:Uma2 family endonuclease
MALAYRRYNEPMAGSDGMKPSGVKLTYDDYVSLPDDGRRHELIDGEHVVAPSPNRAHQSIVWNLTVMIGAYLEQHPIGRAFAAPLDVVFSEFDVVEPDLLFISGAREAEVLTSQHVRGAPDLVVEVSSTATRRRDETVKRRLYERFAVAEYWIVDPDIEAIKVFRRSGDTYTRAELTLEREETLTTPLLPHLQMSLARIFKD